MASSNPKQRAPTPADTVDERGLPAAVLDAAPTLAVVLDRDGRILRFNQACQALTGYSLAEAQGRRVWEFLVPPDEREAVEAVFRALRTERAPSRSEGGWITRTGETKRIAWSNTALLDDAGEVEYVILTGVDLTRQLEAERAARALRISEAKFSGIVSIAADAIISVDDAQRIVLFNEGAEEIFGYSKAEILGRPLDVLIPERFREAHRDVHIPAFASSPVHARRMGERSEIFGLRKDGEEFPAEASISKLDVDGERVFTVVLRDVTRRKRADDAQRFLAEAGVVFSSSLDYATTLKAVARLAVKGLADYCIVDVVKEDGRVGRLEVAHRDPAKEEIAGRLLRYPLDRTRPHLVSGVLETRTPVLVADATAEMLASAVHDEEYRGLLEELRPRSYMAVPLLAHDRVLGAILLISAEPGGRRFDADDLALAQDLAHRAALSLDNARLYGDAQRAIHARDEVIAIVSHDLGNPLSAVFVASRALLRLMPEDTAEAARQQVEGIRAAAEQMDRLITNLLDLRRIEAGRLVLERRPHAPTSLLREVEESFRLLAAGNSLDFEVECDAAAPVYVDRDRIIQVFSNLVGNAAKFTAPGGRIGVRATHAGGDVRFEVWDTGPGIAPDQLPHLFDRFWQARRSGRRSVGLGLSIAKGIVDAHGGSIWAESEPGRGATFSFTVPVAPPPTEAAARPAD